jgi:hypothetical protein
VNVLHVAAVLAMTLATDREFPSNAEMQARSRWFGAWECPTFKLIYFQPVVPRAKNPKDAELVGVPAGLYEKLDRMTSLPYAAAAYDAGHRVAYALDAMSSPYLVQPAGPPPLPALRVDLGGVRLRSGITIGTRASRVVAVFGKPSAQHGCGSELYTYALGPRHAAILFTIHRDRVVRIEWFEDD